MSGKKKPLIILTGPTAVGKTELSVSLAKEINGAIISADSMQVYRYMDIGSAKITKEEMAGIPHYLIDELMPDEEFNVVKFQECAKGYLKEIYERGQIPILVGGTGFYIQAVLYDIDFTEEKEDTEYRKKMERLAKEEGARALYERLKAVDEQSARTIHPNNTKRMIRALEFYEKTGTRISEHNERERQKESPYQFAYFVLNDDRKRIYDRIDLRVEKMLEAGLIEEVSRLKEMGYTRDLVSMQGLGYKEILDYLNGDLTLEEAVYILKRDTRHFAKRQLTWFRREKEVLWIDKGQFEYENEKILDYIKQELRERGIL